MINLSKARMIFDGVEQLMVQDLSIEARGNHAEVRTTAGGRIGNVKGSPDSTVTATMAVPEDGFETSFFKFVNDGSYHKIVILSGARQFKCEGWFNTNSLKISEGGFDAYDFVFEAGPVEES